MLGKKRSGQILILVLLVVVVALAVGLSVASRNLTNLRTSTQAEQSQRAFTAAEGGVEDVLSRLNQVANHINDGTSGSTVNGCTKASSTEANCTLPVSTGIQQGNVKIVASKAYEKTVEPGDVAQINLDTYDPGASFDIEWSKAGENNPRATLEIFFVCSGGTSCMGDSFSGSYGQHRELIAIETISGQTGVPLCSSAGGVAGTGDFSSGCKKTFTIPSGATNVKLLRMKPFWSRATIRVTPAVANQADFPIQTYEITSTATTDTGVSRKVEVKRDALPQLPAIFDYVLYSEKDIVK